eukprot:TRINITY_DN14297_c0_g1_i1.p1 TRINITY_DN14297_c0_g1~~TRINITY_DN14297_c0_g1_i1.p1  ORF type:complete len:407 (-),score=71.75 TRINITY_DN14297_c0_g1_i1:529-1749(-)
MALCSVIFLFFFSVTSGKVSLYLSSDQTEALYGIKTPGLFYITEGVVNKYAMNFQHQVIPAEVDHIDFTWEAKKGSAVPYKITFMHAPSKAMENPTVNISTTGLVPTHTDKFRLLFPCTGKVAAQVETLFQISFSIRRKSPEVLNFKRNKVCKISESPAEELVADPSTKSVPTKSVLLSSVSPSMFVTLGAASASVILLTVVLASLYIRRVRKRDSQLAAGASLRSSLQLNSDEEYMEKHTANTVVSSSDSYDTLASFTQVPVSRTEATSWARYSTPSVADYASPMPKQEWRTADSRCSGQTTTSSPLVIRHNSSKPASMASLHSGHVYNTKLHGSIYSDLTPTRTQQRVRPLYTNTEGPPYQQYQYTMAQPGDASPYSVSSELYKHVLPQYFQFSRPKSRGSVLV